VAEACISWAALRPNMVDMMGKFFRFQSQLSCDAITFAVRCRRLRGTVTATSRRLASAVASALSPLA
jgi:hypothetical protein